jgi:hypothetical protein
MAVSWDAPLGTCKRFADQVIEHVELGCCSTGVP